ncbi:diguanylate cyclase [Cohnella sp. CFH 77786]|uniref:GGDEF domain-containing protein n=1 Tax=Cohnella sp. CFH 77786 TaxID=2662265 RepID=UPI001C608457|nr:diguanylate cyclase [Cohnella sp. CFH 77786]
MRDVRQTSFTSIKVLLIEDNPGDARLIREAMSETDHADFDVLWADSLEDGIERLSESTFDVVLLDLSLPDSQGLETIKALRDQAKVVPIVVLTGLDDEQTAIRAVQYGAQDYLIKGQVNGGTIMRAMRYAIERNRLQDKLYNLSIIDELTGLYNRRGIYSLLENDAGTLGTKGYFIVVADMDGMKQINDSFGHHAGDQALVDTARILKEVFHGTDMIGRMGGDEFMVIFPQNSLIPMNPETLEQEIAARMKHKLDDFNQSAGRSYHLSLSLGLSYFNPDSPLNLNELIIDADQRMYADKREKKTRSIR